MRIRSCQLVYVLMLLCAVQVVEARALGLVATGTVGSVAALREGGATASEMVTGQAAAGRDTRAKLYAACERADTPVEWTGPSAHAAAISSYTSFQRG